MRISTSGSKRFGPIFCKYSHYSRVYYAFLLLKYREPSFRYFDKNVIPCITKEINLLRPYDLR